MPVLTAEIDCLELSEAQRSSYIVMYPLPDRHIRMYCNSKYEVWVKGKCIYIGNSAVDACEWYNEERTN